MSVAELTEDVDLRLKELEHRVKNILAVVRWITLRTLEESSSVEQAKATVEARLSSLDGAINQLLCSEWSAAHLPDLAQKALSHFELHSARVRIKGEPIEIGPRSAMTLSLAFNELATNALKYGALSNDAGFIELSWKVLEAGQGPHLWIQWAERGGPPVLRPQRQGFGTRLICSAVGRTVGGRAELDFLESGVVWTLHAPLETIAR